MSLRRRTSCWRIMESWVRSAGVRTSIHSACSRTKRAVVCAAMALPAA